jgi:hypothetical protein
MRGNVVYIHLIGHHVNGNGKYNRRKPVYCTILLWKCHLLSLDAHLSIFLCIYSKQVRKNRKARSHGPQFVKASDTTGEACKSKPGAA